MSEQLYRLTVTPSNPADTDAQLTAHEMLVEGWLVPVTDERLTRAEWEAAGGRCEHGYLDRHEVDKPGDWTDPYVKAWCPGGITARGET